MIDSLDGDTEYIFLIQTVDTTGNTSDGVTETATPSSTWVDPEYPKRIRLSFDNSEHSSDLEDFPLLVVLNETRVEYDDFETGGTDIRFIDPDDESNLPYEIELWDTGGTSWIWVLVNSIDQDSTDDCIYMYYNNSSATSDVQDPDTLWADYELVYHFAETSGTDIDDSTSNGRAGTTPVALDSTLGQICTGFHGYHDPNTDPPASYTTKQYVSTGINTYSATSESWTIESWVKADASPLLTSAGGYANGPIMGGTVYNFGWDHNSTTYIGSIQFHDGSWKAASLGGTSLLGDTWYYMAGVFGGVVDSKTVTSYRDGAEIESVAANNTVSSPVDLFIGIEENTNHPFSGVIDEVRITSMERSEDFIFAQYLSMTDDFITYSAPMDVD